MVLARVDSVDPVLTNYLAELFIYIHDMVFWCSRSMCVVLIIGELMKSRVIRCTVR